MLTEVELVYLPGRVERWIRFGRFAEERIIDRRRRVLAFAPREVFALVRWEGGDYGTARSRIDILRAVEDGEPFTILPYVAPGGELLLHLQGWPKVEAVLRAIDAAEDLGLAARAVAPDHWRHIHNRLSAGLPPRDYDLRRHQAWLRRRALAA